MRISELQSLLKVAELKSISRAAEQLYITQQGLSRIISNMEKELDIQLFIRRNNTLELTDIGEKVVEHARILIDDYSAMLRDINHYQAPAAQESDYTLFATSVTSITLMPQIFPLLYQAFPMTKFSIIENVELHIADQSDLNENSIGLLSIPSYHVKLSKRIADGSVCFESRFRDTLMLNVQKDSALARKSMITREELSDIPISLHLSECLMLERLLGGASSRMAVHTTSHELCRSMVAKGMAAGITSDFIEYYMPSDNTIRIPLENTVEIEYGYIYAPDAMKNPVTKFIVGLLEQEFHRCTEYYSDRC